MAEGSAAQWMAGRWAAATDGITGEEAAAEAAAALQRVKRCFSLPDFSLKIKWETRDPSCNVKRKTDIFFALVLFCFHKRKKTKHFQIQLAVTTRSTG